MVESWLKFLLGSTLPSVQSFATYDEDYQGPKSTQPIKEGTFVIDVCTRLLLEVYGKGFLKTYWGTGLEVSSLYLGCNKER